MGKPQRRLGAEFEAETVRLVETSGRMQRDLEAPPPERREDPAAELKRLRCENGMKARQRRRFKRTTDSPHAFPVAPNLLDQDFAAAGPNLKWGADIA